MNQFNIHLFKMYKKYYLYDTNTNAIIKVPEEVYVYLEKTLKGEKTSALSEENQRGMLYLKENGVLDERTPDILVHFETDLLESLFQNNLSALTLQVTQNCNLRCKYCVYSGSYINRVHTNKRMDWNTAKCAIDFFYKHSSGSRQVSFGFYGGEPLLEIELIKKCVDYIKELFKGKKITYVLTTNATLLNEEILDFFVENDFAIMISLDGPEQVQNGNRVFADGEKGTFDVVMNKIKMIEKRNPEYLEKINFNAVIDLKQDFYAANDFFMNYDNVKKAMVRGSFVNNINRKEKEEMKYEYLIDSKYEEFKTMLYFCKNIFIKYEPKLLRGYMESIKQNLVDRDIVKNKQVVKSTVGGQCIPGIQRLFVTVEGRLYPCERVNENSEEFCIGDIYSGFNIEQAKKLLNISQLTEKECQKCWCHKICSQCVTKADDEGKLSRKKRLENCKATRANAEKMIKDYITLKKYDCDFYKMEVEI